MEKTIVLVGAKGFWSMRERVHNLLPPLVQLVYHEHLRLDCEDGRNVQALVVADQPIGPAVLDQYPGLKTIARTGTGYDNIDLVETRKRGIVVTRVAQLNAEAVSEFTLGLIMELTKNISLHNQHMLEECWKRVESIRLCDLSVGVVGLGTVGRSLSLKLHHLGAKRILGWNHRLRPEVDALCETSRLEYFTELEALLVQSDVLVLSVSLTTETRGLIGKRELSLMKPGAFLVNVCRGAVVNEEALARFVAEGRLGGVALDVFSAEPPASSPFSEPFMQSLLQSARAGRKVILTPHTAGITTRTVELISLQVARNIAGALSGNLDGVEVVA